MTEALMKELLLGNGNSPFTHLVLQVPAMVVLLLIVWIFLRFLSMQGKLNRQFIADESSQNRMVLTQHYEVIDRFARANDEFVKQLTRLNIQNAHEFKRHEEEELKRQRPT